MTVAVALAALAWSPGQAEACGGFFCSSSPVDQEAERILFQQVSEDTIAAYVEIRYQGDPEDFAWVVPVPAVPTLDTWSGRAFAALDQATQPQYLPPWQCLPNAGFAEDDADGARGAGGPADEVIVHSQERVGPFDTAVVESRDPDALVVWLRENGYRIVEEMEPFVGLYTAEGMKFVALKLAPGEGVDAIDPIKMTYQGALPSVPLKLTSIAAIPEMGVKVWVLGKERFGPANMAEIKVDDDEIVFDQWGYQNNYVPLVARKVDGVGGHGYVIEYAKPAKELADIVRESFVPDRVGQEGIDARDALVKLLESGDYLTRLYTRVSPSEMDLDPIFAADGGPDVDNVHDLSDREGDQCGEIADPDPCEFAACGAAGLCAQPDAAALDGVQGGQPAVGCACADGAVARAVPDDSVPDGMRIACADARLNFMPEPGTVEIMPSGAPLFAAACLNDPCGANGRCVDLNGTATCACEQGFIAVPLREILSDGSTGGVRPTCVQPLRAIPAQFYLQTAPKEPALPYPGRLSPLPADPTPSGGTITGAPVASGSGKAEGGFCAVGGAAPTATLLGFVLLLAPVLRRRR